MLVINLSVLCPGKNIEDNLPIFNLLVPLNQQILSLLSCVNQGVFSLFDFMRYVIC